MSHQTIHFVCRANIFRSRIAQAYLRSKYKNLNVISSGVDANKNEKGSTAWHTEYLLKKHKLKKYDVKDWQQTNQALIDQSDFIVFMASDVYKDAQKIIDLGNKQYRVWEIVDILRPTNLNNDKKRAEEVYKTITQNVDALTRELC